MEKCIETSKPMIFQGERAIDQMVELCLRVTGGGKIALFYNEDSHQLAYDIGKILGKVGIFTLGVDASKKENILQSKLQEVRIVIGVGDRRVGDIARLFASDVQIDCILLPSALPNIDMMRRKIVQNGRYSTVQSPLAVVCDTRIVQASGLDIAGCIGELCAILTDSLDLTFWAYCGDKSYLIYADYLADKIKSVIDVLACTQNKAGLLQESVLEIGKYLSGKDIPATPTQYFGIISGYWGNIGNLADGIRKMIGASTIAKIYTQMLKLDNMRSPNLDIVQQVQHLAKSIDIPQVDILNRIDLSDKTFHKAVLQEYHNELYDKAVCTNSIIKRASKEFRRALYANGVELGEFVDGKLPAELAKYAGILDGNNSILSLIYR